MKRILFLLTGGTIFQQYDKNTNEMKLTFSIQDLMSKIKLDAEYDLKKVSERSGAYMSWEIVIDLRDSILANLESYDCFVVITGTRI